MPRVDPRTEIVEEFAGYGVRLKMREQATTASAQPKDQGGRPVAL